MSDYEKQANDFCEKYDVTINVKFLKHGYHCDTDKEPRDIYTVTISRPGRKSFTFDFGQSINDSGFYFQIGKQQKFIDRKHLNVKDALLPKVCAEWDFMSKHDKIHRPKAPNYYDILACLTKIDPENFENFCGRYGYDTDSRSAEKTYQAVQEEYNNVFKMFYDCLEELQEIS